MVLIKTVQGDHYVEPPHELRDQAKLDHVLRLHLSQEAVVLQVQLLDVWQSSLLFLFQDGFVSVNTKTKILKEKRK